MKTRRSLLASFLTLCIAGWLVPDAASSESGSWLDGWCVVTDCGLAERCRLIFKRIYAEDLPEVADEWRGV